jgi:hypothetical protein
MRVIQMVGGYLQRRASFGAFGLAVVALGIMAAVPAARAQEPQAAPDERADTTQPQEQPERREPAGLDPVLEQIQPSRSNHRPEGARDHPRLQA